MNVFPMSKPLLQASLAAIFWKKVRQSCTGLPPLMNARCDGWPFRFVFAANFFQYSLKFDADDGLSDPLDWFGTPSPSSSGLRVSLFRGGNAIFWRAGAAPEICDTSKSVPVPHEALVRSLASFIVSSRRRRSSSGFNSSRTPSEKFPV